MNTASQPVKNVVTRLEWDLEVVDSPLLSIVLFYSEVSEPSLRMIPTFSTLTERFPSARFFTVNTDKHPEITWNFRVSIVPTVMMFKNKQKLHEIITLKSEEDLAAAIQPLAV